MNGCLSLWLGQESHTECPKIGPQQEVEGVEGVCASSRMLHIFLPAKQSLRRELYSTVVEKTIRSDFGIVLRGEQ